MLHFPTLFCHLIIHANDQAHLKKCLSYLEIKTGKSLAELLPTNRQKVLVDLLTKFNFSKERITQALSMCARNDNSFKHSEKKKDTNLLPKHVVANYVSKGLMAVLSSFVISFSHRDTQTEVKLQIIKSLNDIILFLKYENLVSSKNALLDCIKLATNVSKNHLSFEDDVLTLWESFLKTMVSNPESLVGILPQILCCLLPHLSTSPGRTVKIFKFLLQDNISHYR